MTQEIIYHIDNNDNRKRNLDYMNTYIDIYQILNNEGNEKYIIRKIILCTEQFIMDLQSPYNTIYDIDNITDGLEIYLLKLQKYIYENKSNLYIKKSIQELKQLISKISKYITGILSSIESGLIIKHPRKENNIVQKFLVIQYYLENIYNGLN